MKSLPLCFVFILNFSSKYFVSGLEESDIIPIKVIGRFDNDRDFETSPVSSNTGRRANRRDEGLVNSKCMKCLCHASTKCKVSSCKNTGPDSYFCGPFQATWSYWNDGGEPTVPGGLPSDHKHAFEECLNDYECASRAVTGYMTKHQQNCNDDGVIDCYDFARIHKAGPYSCDADWVENQNYWTRFLDCMDDKVRVQIPKSNPAPRPKLQERKPPVRRRPGKEPDYDTETDVSVAPSGRIVNDQCLKCLCYANSKCESRGCTGAANICGPFQATWVYWADGGKPTVPGGLAVDHPHSFEECLKDYKCSSRAVEGYMKKHYKNCDEDRRIDCYDFAKIHKGGPNSCPTKWLENQEYWKRFEDCMSGDTDVRIPSSSVSQSSFIIPRTDNRPANRDEYKQPSSSDETGSAIASSSPANIDDKCLRCLCHASTKCQAKGCVNSGPESYFCGPFQATWVYWSDGGKQTVPGGFSVDHKHAFEECLKDYDCAARTVKGYMNKHKQDCDDNANINCYDFARIHKAGPYSCGAKWVEGQEYWNQFLECMNDEVDVRIPGEKAPAKNEGSSYLSNDRETQYNDWQQPPEPGSYNAPATSRPQSNARLPPFAQHDQLQYSDSPDTRKKNTPLNYQPESSDRRRGSNNRRRPPNSEVSGNPTRGSNDRRRPSNSEVSGNPRGSNDRRSPSNLEGKAESDDRRKPTDIQGTLVNEKCLQCLCYASSQCESLGCFNDGAKTDFCGPFQATHAYWKAAGSPKLSGGSGETQYEAYQECLKDYDCATETVERYMQEHQKNCDSDPKINCYDFARIHRLGPNACGGSAIESTEYWNRLRDCMDGYVTFE